MASLDIQRLRRLLPYLGRDRRRLLLSLLLLIPLALAGAVQPLLVGQAISVLRQEASLPWLAALPVPVALRLLVGLLLVAVLLRLALQGTQSFNVQVVGQRLTARIRADLFRHALGLSLRFSLITLVALAAAACGDGSGDDGIGTKGDVVGGPCQTTDACADD